MLEPITFLSIIVVLQSIGSILSSLKIRRLESDLMKLDVRFTCTRQALWQGLEEVEDLARRT